MRMRRKPLAKSANILSSPTTEDWQVLAAALIYSSNHQKVGSITGEFFW